MVGSGLDLNVDLSSMGLQHLWQGSFISRFKISACPFILCTEIVNHFTTEESDPIFFVSLCIVRWGVDQTLWKRLYGISTVAP
jgi:hypothetical protein